MSNKYSEKKYAMGIESESTQKHPYGKGAAHLSAETLVERGRRYRGGQSYKLVGEQLQEQANLRQRAGEREAHDKFAAAAKLAREKARRAGEYKTERSRVRA